MKTDAAADKQAGACWWLLFVGLITALLCLPSLRVIFWTGDEGLLLDGGQRLLQGDRLYADYFEGVPPGGILLMAAWLGSFGLSIASARLLALLILVGIACFTYLACLRASRNKLLSACIAIACIGIALSRQTLFMMTINHHWFTTLFSMVGAWAALVSIEQPAGSRRWPLVSGLANGMAAMVIPTCGSLGAIAGATGFWKLRTHRTEMLAYVIGLTVIPLGLLTYIIAQGSVVAAFEDTIVFPFTRYSSIQGLPFATGSDTATRLAKYVYPLAAMSAIILCAREWRICRSDRVFWVCLALAIAGFFASYPRPDIYHIVFTSPLACPLLACCADRIGARLRPRYRAILIAFVCLGLVPTIISYATDQRMVLRAEHVPTPRGDTVFVGQPGTPEMLARIARTPPGDGYFFYPYMPMMPYLTARGQVSKIDLFTPHFTTPTQYQEVCVAVMQHAIWVVIDRHWTDPQWLAVVFPALKDARPTETVQFERALELGFDLVGTDATFELRHRRESANESLCTGIAR